MKKKCRKCYEEKPLTEFHKDKSKPDGLNIWCKTCVRLYQKDRDTYNRKMKIELERELFRQRRLKND